ncbi:ATP-grasp domain-containing protein [Streptomyces pini]|uniref:ATP-grasp domain-containing protein n=1 Tax=Streptomyces pini TaxID=1520580 RepID=A0A1I4LXY3_9ACTN|nr:ATP-grasp domain-containing protein [Streptomyces pini]SFL95871.1 ATP-grasp domain-containing protein [Streptomyces pini]
MGKDRGVLLLSHVGFSFMEDLVDTVRSRGLKTCVLSSMPEPKHQGSRPGTLADLADDVRVTAEHVLTPRDVEEYLDHLEAAGTSVSCCLTVWEGYRYLMALANARLGVPDLDEKQVLELRDKLTLRNRLADAGLSRGRASALTPERLAERQREGGRYFVKPISGIASFGTFPLSADTTWTDLERIAAEVRSDTVYAGVFTTDPGPGGPAGPGPRPETAADKGAKPHASTGHDRGFGMEFLVEDYVPGREFSFEVIVVDDEPHVVAVHEKCEVTEAAGTVLENACVSPPTSLSQEEIAAGIRWVARVLDTLGLGWGCFHVEARHAPSGWDLIEVNPRVAGSLISPSVAAMTGGPSLLDLWLDSLLTARRPAGFLKTLKGLSFSADGTTRSGNATFFRVFFAAPGTIREVGLNDALPLRPVVAQILLNPGDTVETSSREVFLGQVLWSMDRADQDAILPGLLPASERAIEVLYETERG